MTAAGGGPGPSPGRLCELAIWGLAQAGKTALLARLVDQEGAWRVEPTESSVDFVQGMRSCMGSQHLFPPASVKADPLDFTLVHRQRGVEVLLRLEDRPGDHCARISTELRQQVQRAHGFVLVVDPLTAGPSLDELSANFLDVVHLTGAGAARDRPMAVCVSKADELIDSPAALQQAAADPDTFVRGLRQVNSLVRGIERRYNNLCFFPVSAAGLRLRFGVVERVVFYDEVFRPRLAPGGEAVNIMAPFSWLLTQVLALP